MILSVQALLYIFELLEESLDRALLDMFLVDSVQP